MTGSNPDNFSSIPDKRYFNIGEASELCNLKPHVLRFWEQEFPELQPKRNGNRRFYHKKDVLLIRKIKTLLYKKGFTIEGARVQLSGETEESPDYNRGIIQETINSLETILDDIKKCGA